MIYLIIGIGFICISLMVTAVRMGREAIEDVERSIAQHKENY